MVPAPEGMGMDEENAACPADQNLAQGVAKSMTPQAAANSGAEQAI
jgi:hypothetical protein